MRYSDIYKQHLDCPICMKNNKNPVHKFGYYEEKIKYLDELIMDLVIQSCRDPNGDLDSMAIGAYADAMYYLESIGKIKVKDHYGRRVIAEIVK